MLETGRRTVQDVATRRHIARVLAVPAHLLGVTDSDDTDHRSMVSFAESAVRLADLARAAGRAADAVPELWAVVLNLERRVGSGHPEPDVLRVLALARTSLGVCLGTILPEERLQVAVRWTGRGETAARLLSDEAPGLWSSALQMHGNELRKIGRNDEAVRMLCAAVESAPDDVRRGPALVLLARAAAQAGDAGLFSSSRRAVDGLLAEGGPIAGSPLVHPYVWTEVRLRGLLDLGRPAAAIDLAAGVSEDAGPPPAPQWSVIAAVTMARVLLTAGDRSGAIERLEVALEGARRHRLPHQAQRTARLADRAEQSDLADRADRIVAELAGAQATGTGSRWGGKT